MSEKKYKLEIRYYIFMISESGHRYMNADGSVNTVGCVHNRVTTVSVRDHPLLGSTSRFAGQMETFMELSSVVSIIRMNIRQVLCHVIHKSIFFIFL